MALFVFTVDWYNSDGVLEHTPVVSRTMEGAIDYIRRDRKDRFVRLGKPLCGCGSPKCNQCEETKPRPWRCEPEGTC